MSDKEKRAHDLAISFVNYKLSINPPKNNADFDSDSYLAMYQKYYDEFLAMLTCRH